MKNIVRMSQWRDTIREQFSFSAIFLTLALLATFFLGVALDRFSLLYSIAAAGAMGVVIIVVLGLDVLTVVLIVAVHIFIDTYLDFGVYQIAMLMALVLLCACYFRRSADHTLPGPRPIWLWVSFLILNIYPTLNGGAFKLTNSIAFYFNVVLNPFIMFWLGNIIAKDISAVRRVFQLLSVLAVVIAIHTIIQATTGIFLFETAHAESLLIQYSNFQAEGAKSVSRVGSFLFNPDGDGNFLAVSFFLPLGLFVDSKQFWTKAIYLVETLLILLALVFTYSTGSLVALLIGVVVFVFLVGRIRYSILLLILMMALAVIAFSFFPSQIDTQLNHANSQSFSDHVANWQTAARVTEAYPLTGVGLGDQAYLVRSNPYLSSAQTTPQAEPDNSYLQWGAISGIPVMLVYLLLLGYVFWFSWRNWLVVDIRYRPLLGGGVVALIALSINSLVINGWTDPGGMATLGWLIAGLIASPLIGRRSGSPGADRGISNGQHKAGFMV